MGKAKPVEIGTMTFEKKGDALDHFKEMLNSYKLNEKVSPSHTTFLKAAILKHPESLEKVGAGIDHFVVRSADYGTRCFWIIRVDGTEEKFSYKSCV